MKFFRSRSFPLLVFGLILAAVLALIWQTSSPKDVKPEGSGQAQAQLKPPTSAESTAEELVQDKPQGKAPEEPAHDEADVFGIVRDEAGRPISGADVKAIQCGGLHWGLEISTATIEDGTYSLSGLHFPSASPYQIVASSNGYAHAYSESFYLNDAPKRVDLSLTVGAFLSGRVTDESRRAIPGATLKLLKGEPASLMSEIRTRTDADGAFVFENISPGNYWLWADAKSYISQNRQEPKCI